MEKVRQKIKWDTWPEYGKTGFFILLIVGVTHGGYGIFMVGMGTSSPLVVVTSDSMSPTLERGYLLVLEHQAAEDILVGEIIVYNADWHSQAPVVHRVIQREFVNDEYRYYTQGDNNNQPDPFYRTYDDIVGVVIASVPFIGNITLFLQQPGVLPGVIVILIILMIVPEFFPNKDDDEADDTKTESDTDAPNV